MSKNLKKFTLLEVIVSLIILTLGVSALLWQLSTASARMIQNEEDWLRSHELSQAAEYLLLYGPVQEIDREYLSGDYVISFRYLLPDISGNMQTKVQGYVLKTLQISLIDGNRELESWSLECFVKEQNE